MELDTAVRHNLPVLVVISLNGGWTADPKREKPGRELGYTRYDKMAEALGAYGDYVDKAEDIRPALERAQREVDKGKVAGPQRAHRLPRPRRHAAIRAVLDVKNR
jgi:thiamine pyrophosphate-dependent acetolactate synthase large subunit-like protein